MSSLSQFQMAGGGGKLRFAEFLTNGTFTPSAALIANGGQVFYEGAGGGGGGGAYFSAAGGDYYGGGGGSSYNRGLLTIKTPQAVTIGTGGAGKSYPGVGIPANGDNGTATTLGSLLTISGGGGGGVAYTRSLGKAAHLGRPGTAPTKTASADSNAGQGGGEGGGSPATSGTANSGGGGGGGTDTSNSSGNGGSGYLRLWWYE